MSFARNLRSQGGTTGDEYWPSFSRNGLKTFNNFNHSNKNWSRSRTNNFVRNYNNTHYVGNYREHTDTSTYSKPDSAPSFKRRKLSATAWGDGGRQYVPPNTHEFVPSASNNFVPYTRSNGDASVSTTGKRDRSKLDEDELAFMSRDEIERYSPSRKDGIDSVREAHLRYSYCSYLQNLGLRLELPQTTIATAMVLCHRFFARRSHACHDRFLVSTAALFLSAKSEETPRPLNNVLRASCEILHKQDISFLTYMLPIDWFEQYRERVTEAEQMILTTLNFELGVQHPYDPLTSILNKLGLSQTVLVNLSLSLASEFSMAPVQTKSYCCWSCLPCREVSKFGSRFLSKYLARVPGHTRYSSRCFPAVDGTLLVGWKKMVVVKLYLRVTLALVDKIRRCMSLSSGMEKKTRHADFAEEEEEVWGGRRQERRDDQD